MRSVLFAYQEVGYVCLETLLDIGADIAAVFSHEDDPDETIWFRSVAELAASRGLPVFSPQRVGTEEWLDRLREWRPDFLFSFYYRKVLPAAVLSTARLGALNLHGSLLPRYRGRCPVNWVLINGERETGVTLHYMEAKPDTGDIVAQQSVPIAEDDTVRSLYAKMTAAAGELLRETYPLLCAGRAQRIPQDAAEATTFGGRRPEDGRIDWRAGARMIYDLIRAVTHPYPGAFAHWCGRPLLIWEARVADEEKRPDGVPGRVSATDGGLVVETGCGRLRVMRVQYEGEEELPAMDWARRYGLEEGVVLE